MGLQDWDTAKLFTNVPDESKKWWRSRHRLLRSVVDPVIREQNMSWGFNEDFKDSSLGGDYAQKFFNSLNREDLIALAYW